jgi:hypothetical protein
MPASSAAKEFVSKRLGSPHRSGRSAHWVKVKNPKAPAVKCEAEEDWGLSVAIEKIDARQITTRSRQAADQAELDRVLGGEEYDPRSGPVISQFEFSLTNATARETIFAHL